MGTVIVEALREAIRLRATRRSRDLRIGTSGCARTPPAGIADRAAPSAHSLTARELIAMAQAARRTRSRETREG
ncbi:hypothetical protein FV226_10250 [Methylobacterium sp. WL12]|uniref:hypothetical protein n=1 Tax=Methylobacterium sp. WL12 TaxID=2603890 RepID=UPI0011C6ED68|nr:hypothetical protein [Methylobacterium sp. WL12]TXM73062.1 hypothetical protein FV226_10250 [Methylobacterium sp. WL12]